MYDQPGTGKSSLICTFAVDDIKSDSELRMLLMSTANRSVLVVEDIDCSVELNDQLTVKASRALAKKKDQNHYSEEKNVCYLRSLLS